MASASRRIPAPAHPRALRDPLGLSRGRVVEREAARYLGAGSLLAVGAIHAQQYYGAYFSVVPTIGVLFLLSFVGAGIAGLALLAPIGRLGSVLGRTILVLAAFAGIGIAVGTLVSLLVSEYMPLFGFMESGYRLAIVLTLLFDGLTTLLLGIYLAIAVPPLVARLSHRGSGSGASDEFVPPARSDHRQATNRR